MGRTERAIRTSAGLATVITMLGLAGPARSADVDYAGMLLQNQSLLSNPPKTCGDKNPSLNTFELQQCAAVAFKKADGDLNKAYQDAIRQGDVDQNGKLKQAQRFWLSLRNAQCDWELSQYQGGTLRLSSWGTASSTSPAHGRRRSSGRWSLKPRLPSFPAPSISILSA